MKCFGNDICELQLFTIMELSAASLYHYVWFIVIVIVARVSLCLCVGHNHKPYKHGWTDRGVVWDIDSGVPKEPCISLGHVSPWERGKVGGILQPIMKHREYLVCGWHTQLCSVGGGSDAASGY